MLVWRGILDIGLLKGGIMKKKRVGFISTRLAGTDGVSLETQKWAEVLSQEGHECFFMAGELDTPPERSRLVKDCHFRNKRIWGIYEGCFNRDTRSPEVSREVEVIKHNLKNEIFL